MYIRAVNVANRRSGGARTHHQLVECHRTEKGPRQRMIMHLGPLDLPPNRWRELASALEIQLTGQQVLFPPEADIQALTEEILTARGVEGPLRNAQVVRKSKAKPDLVAVDLNSLATSESRSVGPELVGHTFYQRLGFPEMLAECGLTPYQRDLAEAVILGRLVAPDSDLGTWRWLRARSSLSEFLASNLENVGKDAVYEIADRLWEHRKFLEAGLREREQALFPRGDTVVLYDLTNTHFEGRCLNNPLAKRGHSKQMRTDCPLVTLALVVDSQGFPLFSQIYEGNQVEPPTLIQVLERLKDDSGSLFDGVKPTVVMDRGIAIKANLALLRKEGYPYLVIERRDEAKDFEGQFREARKDFQLVPGRAEGERVWLRKLAPEPEDADAPTLARVLCLSEGRALKEKGIDQLKETRFLEDLEKLAKSIARGYVKEAAKANQRIGRLLQRYPSVAKRYKVNLHGVEDVVTRLTWERTDQATTREILQGCYVLQTTHLDLEPERIWSLYMTLSRVEAAFKALKSDLGLRPIRHHGDPRTRAHLFISVLAYHLLASIERTLHLNGDNRSWATLRKDLSTHQRCTVTLRGAEIMHQVRLSGTPEPVHQEIYRTLAIKDTLARRRRDLRARV